MCLFVCLFVTFKLESTEPVKLIFVSYRRWKFQYAVMKVYSFDAIHDVQLSRELAEIIRPLVVLKHVNSAR